MEHAIKYFGLNNVALENDLRRVAREKKSSSAPRAPRVHATRTTRR